MLDLDVARRPSFELNGLLIDSVQRTLTRLSIADQAYAYLKSAVPDVPLEDFNVAARAGPEAAEVFETTDGSDFNSLSVPALFTYNGFQNFFLPHLAGVAEQLVGEAWVRGDVGKQFASEDQLKTLGPQLLQLYANDFVASWNKVLATIRLKRLPGDKPDYATLAVLSNAQTSPIPTLVKAIVQETALTKEPDDGSGGASGGAGTPNLPNLPSGGGAAGQLGQQMAKFEADKIANQTGGLARIGIQFAMGKSSGRPGDTSSGASTIPGANIEAQFQGYALALNGTPSPLDTVVSNLNDVYRNLVIADRDPSQQAQATSAMSLAVSNLGANASRFPKPIQAIINKAANDLEGNAASSNLAQLNDALSNNVVQICKQLTQNLYPFSPRSSRDLPMGDFARLFAPGGLLDKFFADNLASLVDMSGAQWQWKQDNPLAAQLSPEALVQFQRAQQIRDAFFPPNSQVPAVQMSITPMTLNAAADSATLSIDGTNIVSQPVASVPVAVTWPSPTGSGLVSLTLSPDMPGRPSNMSVQGPWALMRFFSSGIVSQSGGAMRVQQVVGGRDVSYRVQVNTLANPFTLPALTKFTCPTGL